MFDAQVQIQNSYSWLRILCNYMCLLDQEHTVL